MSIWKSPIFYLGLLLLALVVGALVAPFVIDWNGYRGSLEAYGARIAGRKVMIAGPVEVRLFPWPRLEATDVRVANPAGYGEQPFLKAGKMTVNLALAGLASGKIKVESIALEKPSLNLQLDAKGSGNWHFTSDAALRKSGLLDDVQLDEIKVVSGDITLTDARHGWVRQISKVNAVLSGAALEGPWKARGQGTLLQPSRGDLPIDFTLATNVPKAGELQGYTFKLAPLDGSLPSLVFDGKGEGGNFDGKLALEPVVLADGRTNPNGLFKPLSYTAKLSVKGEQADLTAIRIVLADTKESGTLIEGDGHIDLQQGVKAQVSLNSPHVDLDALAGEGLLRLSDQGGLMGLINGLIAQFPESLDLSGKLDVNVLTFGGENMQNFSLKSSAGAGAVRVQDLTTDLPGLSRMNFSGLVFPGKATAELGGTLAFETGDARAFTNWMWPQAKEQVARIWTGQRGRLKMQTDIAWGGRQFSLQNTKYELDGLPGKGGVSVAMGANPTLDVNLQADDFDLGAYVPTGFSASGLFPAMSFLLPGDAGFRQNLDLNFGRLTLNGVSATNVVVNIIAASSGFEIKRLDIGAVEGAELRGNGLVLVGQDGPSGEVKFGIAAPRPQGLMRLLGLLPKGPDPIWVQGLGQTNLLADFTVKPGKQEPQVNGSISGKVGALKVVGTGTAVDLSAKDGPSFGVSGTASSSDARDVVRLLGFVPFGPEAGDGQLSFTMQGKLTQNLRAVLNFDGLGATGFFDGTMLPSAPLYGLVGAAKLSAPQSAALFAALGSPLASVGGPFSFETQVTAAPDGLQGNAIAINLSGQKLEGGGRLSATRNIKLDLNGGTWRMADIAGLALAPWNGPGSFPNGRIAANWPLGLTGDLTLKPVALIDPLGVPLANATLHLSANEIGRDFSVASGQAQLDAKLRQKGSAFELEGAVAYPFSLNKAFAFASKPSVLAGEVVYKSSFKSEGFSPLALLRGASGKGMLSLNGVNVNSLAPDPFYAAATAAKSGDELSKAFANLNKGAGVGFAPSDTPCELKDGALRCEPIKTETQQAALSLTPSGDIAEGTLAAEIALTSKSQNTLPVMRLLLSGQPGAMNERLDVAALSAKLGTALINKDMEELARLQKEQQKVEAETAKQSEDDKTKYDNFQAQRNELRLQARMIKVFQQQRSFDAARAKTSVDTAVIYGQSILKDEKRRLLQQLPAR